MRNKDPDLVSALSATPIRALAHWRRCNAEAYIFSVHSTRSCGPFSRDLHSNIPTSGTALHTHTRGACKHAAAPAAASGVCRSRQRALRPR
eukprot:XP_001692624.1 predicted protein [Chlamydomonas reinhardtii]